MGALPPFSLPRTAKINYMARRNIPIIPVVDTAVPVQLFSIFNLGLNTRDNPAALLPGESPDLLNVEASEDGIIQTAKGYVELGTDTTETKVIGIFQYKSGTTKHLIKQVGNLIRKWDGSNWSTIKDHSTGSPLSASAAMCQNALYIVDGVHTGMEKYTGSTSTSNIATPAVFSHIVHLPQVDRLVGIDATNKSRIYFSGAGTPETWGVNDYINVAANDGSDITGIIPCYGPLVICKGQGGRGKFTWDGLTFSSSGLQPLYGSGPANPKAICALPFGGFAFWNKDGVWINSARQDILISDKITPSLQGMTAGQEAKVRLHYHDNKLWLAIPIDAQTENSAVFVYDFNRNQDGSNRGWYKRDWDASEINTFEDSTGNLNLVFGSPTVSKIMRHYRADESTSVHAANGAAQISYWVSSVRFGERRGKPHDFRKLFYSFDSLEDNSVTFSYRSDDSDSWHSVSIDLSENIDNWEDEGLWGEAGDTWPGRGGKAALIPNFNFTSRSLQVRWYKSGINTPIVFYGYGYEQRERESYT